MKVLLSRISASWWVRTPSERFQLLRFPALENAEWFSIRSAFWWWMLLSPSLHLFSSNPLFASLARVAGESVWQSVLGTVLLIQVVSFCWGKPMMRVAGLFLAGTAWAFIVGLTGAAAPHSHVHNLRALLPLTTGIGPYGALAVDCFWTGIKTANSLYHVWLTRQQRIAAGLPQEQEVSHAPDS